MKSFFKGLLILLGLFVFSSNAFASLWTIDTDHSEVRFKVKHIHATVSGQFTEFKGDVKFDPETPNTGIFNFTVSVKSVDTNNGKRDNHLRSKDFFDSEQFPEMTFKSSKISHLKNNRYVLEGKMTIKGTTKMIKTEFEYFQPRQHPFNKKKNVVGFETTFTIPRLDYGVGNGKFLQMGVVGKDVEVELAVEALTK